MPTLAELTSDLTIEATFVPWSKSRHYKHDAKLHEKSLNWDVTLFKLNADGSRTKVLTTAYSKGISHCVYKPKNPDRPTIYDAEQIEVEIEGQLRLPRSNKPVTPPPPLLYVLYCLILDAEVLEYESFEEWAESIGFDPDSRKAEKTHRECLNIGLALNRHLGTDRLRAIREAFSEEGY